MVMEGKDKPQKFRNYSWFVTADRLLALTKANKLQIESLLLDPGFEPWAMALAVSGQKHLLYRTPVNYGHYPWSVRVEDSIVHYSPGELLGRIMLAKSVVAKVGVKRAESFDTSLVMAIGCELAERWQAVVNEPLTKLALFICPSKEDCASCQ
jgi:CRISPR type IV-associated protein Csf1